MKYENPFEKKLIDQMREIKLIDQMREMDSTLEYLKTLGCGIHGEVVKVKFENQEAALKIYNDRYNLDEETKNLRKLSGIEGIPKLIKVYRENKACLLDYVDGKELCESGRQDENFFNQLEKIVEEVNKRGMVMPLDFHSGNVLVGKNGRPYIIDFVASFEISEEEKELWLARNKYQLQRLKEENFETKNLNKTMRR